MLLGRAYTKKPKGRAYTKKPKSDTLNGHARNKLEKVVRVVNVFEGVKLGFFQMYVY